MINSNILYYNYNYQNKIPIFSEQAKLYFSRRKYLKTLIKTIHSKISVNSQSYYLCLFLMDNIFLSNNLEITFYEHFPLKACFIPGNDIQINNYILLSFACLILSYKFYGNKSIKFSVNNLIKSIHYISGGQFDFTSRDLIIGEACVLKILNYKLNFFTAYHYLVFFFTHGIYFRKNLKKNILLSEKKILEKIYIETKEMLEYIMDKPEFYELYNGKDNYIIVMQILKWETEKELNIKLKEDENIFKIIYNINETKAQKENFIKIINEKLNVRKISSLSNVDIIYNTISSEKKNYNNKNKISLIRNTYQNNDKNNIYLNYFKPVEKSKEIKKEIINNEEKEPLDNQKNKKKLTKIKGFISKHKLSKSNKKSLSISNLNNIINTKQTNDKKDISSNFEKFELKTEVRNPKQISINKNISFKSNLNNNIELSSRNLINNKITFYNNLKGNKKKIKQIKMNKTLELEPKDNKRKNKETEIKNNNNNNNNNRLNTIIINNNMNINNYINNNNTNFNGKNTITEIIRFTSFKEKYKIPSVIKITFKNE